MVLRAKGFGKKVDSSSSSSSSKTTNSNSNSIDSNSIDSSSIDSSSSSSSIISDDEISTIDSNNNDNNNDDDANIEKLAKKYGLGNNDNTTTKKKQVSSSSSNNNDDKPFGEDIITKIPLELQGKIDNILIAGVFLSLSWCILCGIGMSAGSLRIVFKDFKLASTIDDLIFNVFDPSFTPSLGIFFFFSITFGLFKYAQIQSSQTTYKEL
jgi:hypothetical protein